LSYPAIPAIFPDIENVLVPWLGAQLEAVYGVTARVCTETPENLASIVPVVAVSKTTGTDILGILDRPVVDIDCFAATRMQAQELGAQVQKLMHFALQGQIAGNAVIGLVSTVKGPGWLTYQDLAVRRCNATYELYCHAIPG
jgi:hypothetical protein